MSALRAFPSFSSKLPAKLSAVKPKKKKPVASAPTRGAGAAGSHTSASPPAAALPRRRKWLFRLTALVLGPLLFFGLLELVLRLVGYGYPVSFFVKNPATGQSSVVENRLFS